jgi:hypothetical protein
MQKKSLQKKNQQKKNQQKNKPKLNQWQQSKPFFRLNMCITTQKNWLILQKLSSD